MSDKIDRLFDGELDAAEREALGGELSSSDEAALRFAAKAEENYRSFGLPEPKWSGPDHLSGISRGFGLANFLKLAMVAGMAALVVWAWKAQGPSRGISAGIQPGLAPSAAKPAVKDTPQLDEELGRNVAQAPDKSILSEGAVPEKAQAKSAPQPLPETAQAAPPVESPSSYLPPIDLADIHHRTYSNLSVEVKWPSEGALRVRVLNGKGLEVKTLYQGPLGAGTWVFDWDGKFPDGSAAPAGSYQIEVKSGDRVKKKSVRIN